MARCPVPRTCARPRRRAAALDSGSGRSATEEGRARFARCDRAGRGLARARCPRAPRPTANLPGSQPPSPCPHPPPHERSLYPLHGRGPEAPSRAPPGPGVARCPVPRTSARPRAPPGPAGQDGHCRGPPRDRDGCSTRGCVATTAGRRLGRAVAIERAGPVTATPPSKRALLPFVRARAARAAGVSISLTGRVAAPVASCARGGDFSGGRCDSRWRRAGNATVRGRRR